MKNICFLKKRDKKDRNNFFFFFCQSQKIVLTRNKPSLDLKHCKILKQCACLIYLVLRCSIDFRSIKTHSIRADFGLITTLNRLGTFGSFVFFIFRLACYYFSRQIILLIDALTKLTFC